MANEMSPKTRPQYTGIVQTKNGETYSPYGKIALWKQPNRTGNQPMFKGTITLENGEKHQVSIWERKNE